MTYSYPSDFLWGVANAAYQVEGHLNGPGDPRNNWFDWERKRGNQRVGKACDFWNQYRCDIDRAAELGLNSFRLGLEWARLQPHPEERLDPAALERYINILAYIGQKGLQPVVTLHHFTHPLWLGMDPWIKSETSKAFSRYVKLLLPALNRGLAEKYSQPPLSFFVTTNEPNILGLASRILGVFPHSAAHRGFKKYHLFMRGLLGAHIEAYRTIHNLYDQQGWPTPRVTFNTWGCALYCLDRFFVDLMLAPAGKEGRVDPDSLKPHFDQWRKEIQPAFSETGLSNWRHQMENFLDRQLWRFFPREIYRDLATHRGRQPALDVLSLDYYDPFLSKYILSDSHLIRLEPWEWDTATAQFPHYMRAYMKNETLPMYILENGMSYKKEPHRPAERPDGKKRGEELKKIIGHLDGLVEEGVDIRGYFYWSITDNYEWGSYLPRFGLCGMDYGEEPSRLETDAAGDRVDLLYREICLARQ